MYYVEQCMLFNRMHALATRHCHTPGPPRTPLSSEKFIPHAPQKKGDERNGKEKRPVRRGLPGVRCRVVHGTTRHLEPLAARCPHPQCCLDEVSFPAGKKKRANDDGGKRSREAERVRCETSRASGFCGVL